MADQITKSNSSSSSCSKSLSSTQATFLQSMYFLSPPLNAGYHWTRQRLHLNYSPYLKRPLVSLRSVIRVNHSKGFLFPPRLFSGPLSSTYRRSYCLRPAELRLEQVAVFIPASNATSTCVRGPGKDARFGFTGL